MSIRAPGGAAMGGNPAPEPIVLRGHGGDVQCVAFATLGGVECLLSGDSNGDVVAWDLALRRPLWRLAAHPPSSGVLSVEAMPGGASSGPGDASERGETSTTRVLTQGRDGTLKCWRASGADAPSPDPAWSVTSGSFHFCRFATWSRDAAKGTLRALAVVGAETSAVDVLAVREGDAPDEPPKRARTFRVPTSDDAGGETDKLGTVMACAFATLFDARAGSADAPLLVVGYEEGTVALWDARDLENACRKNSKENASTEPLWRERVHGDAVTSVAADARRGGFVSAAADGGILRFAIRFSSAATNDTNKDTNKIIVELVQSHGGGRDKEDASLFATATATRGVACVAVRDDGKLFAAGGWDGRTRVYETSDSKKRKPRRLASLGFHDDVVACVAFRTAAGGKGAPHAGWLATGSRDGAVALWPIFPPKNKADGERDEDA